jgi:hypothetical protein
LHFIEQLIFPTLDQLQKAPSRWKNPRRGAAALVLIVAAESALELDDLITSLPVWPRMETEVIPLTTFDARRQTLLSRIQELKAQAIEPAISNPDGYR